jgi:hypothetical protein
VLEADPRLVEALYLCQVQASAEALSGVYAVLGRRRARILAVRGAAAAAGWLLLGGCCCVALWLLLGGASSAGSRVRKACLVVSPALLDYAGTHIPWSISSTAKCTHPVLWAEHVSACVLTLKLLAPPSPPNPPLHTPTGGDA